ncbi:hypothetical protein IKE07_00845 [Candidatus Saccharibacteria bacterium]|nr:hypothetical protein [Candidatus Saccharibacteria bacterium]
MAGTPADLTVNSDSDISHDHTYYGRGCKNGWGTSGEGGSQTPCADSDAGGRFVKTADDETLKNGTYYTFQTITVGSGATMGTVNTNSPDTFCPLGWQLPYSGTGGDYYNKSRSWNKLLTSYSIAFNDGTYADVTKAKSYPFSYVYSGYYYWGTGRLYNQSTNGVYWSSSLYNGNNAYDQHIWSGGIRPSNIDYKTRGYPIRCNFDISILESFPWHPRSLISIMAFHFLKAHFPLCQNYE